MILDKRKMIHCANYKNEDEIEEAEIRRLCREVEDYLYRYAWCKRVNDIWFAGGFSKVAVFFVEIDAIGYDDELWVVVGDLPAAHLVIDEIPDVKEALLSYVYHMREWVSAVRDGRSTSDCFPIDVAPTLKNAKLLNDRLDFIEKFCAKNF